MGKLADLSDEELVQRAQKAMEGDTRAYDLLVRRYQSRVLANCRYLSRSPADAEDLAQEVFVKAYFGLGRFEGRAAFKTWIQRIKVNHCLTFLERRRKQHHVDLEDDYIQNAPALRTASTAERNLKARSDRERIARVLDAMSDTLRIPLILRDSDGLSYQEISDALGLGLSAVKMRIKRGREEFRRLYGHETEENDEHTPRA